MANARYGGTCSCGGRFEAGASVRWDRKGGKLAVVECPSCKPDLHRSGGQAPLELKVKVQKVRYAKPDGSWTVAEALCEGPIPQESPIQADRPFSLVGPFKAQLGDLIEVYGNFQQDPKWGWQFAVQRAIPMVAGTDQALRAFLARFPQVGPRRAEQILQKLGGREAVIRALEHEPLRLTIVSGITEERALEIGKAYQDLADLRDSTLFLAGLDLGEALTAQVLDEFGADAKANLLADPYCLMELRGVGFKRADDIARRLEVERSDPRRLAAAALYLLEEASQEGHTWSSLVDLAGS